MLIAIQAQNTFTRLLAGSLTLTYFFSIFINIGMVIGILPVVGLPLPIISYGGTAVVTTLASFGILMSIHTHRRLVALRVTSFLATPLTRRAKNARRPLPQGEVFRLRAWRAGEGDIIIVLVF